ncbi:heparanase-like [Haliotis rufescens]|uniref:heparanase-like n=1 Tax=Haliotis rufescens TaxID=6454 RepID=UPI00201E83D7|nr:heparanase-like [Haliotis rufescens]
MASSLSPVAVDGRQDFGGFQHDVMVLVLERYSEMVDFGSSLKYAPVSAKTNTDAFFTSVEDGLQQLPPNDNVDYLLHQIIDAIKNATKPQCNSGLLFLVYAKWDELNAFVKNVGWDLVFALNVLKRKDGQWDPDNAKELMTYSNARNYTIPAFELGNEPEYFPEPFTNTISGAQLGRDFVHLREILKSTPGFESTLVIGPDVTGISGPKSILFQNFFAGEGSKAVDRITFHQYYAFEGDATVNTCLDPKVMDSLISDIHRVRNVTSPSNPDTPLWLGETSSFYGGGTPALSDRYVAGFLWLDKLGVASRMGLKGVLRQSYYGHNYSLIEMNTFEPYSDYWLTLLYKRLVGNKVLSVQTNSTNSFRVYAHCAKQNSVYNYKPGSVVVYIVNVNIYTTVVTFPQFQKNMDLFWLRPEFIELTSRNVTLNGKRLDYVNNSIPYMPPQKAYGGLLMLPARTFGFAVFPDADVDICK